MQDEAKQNSPREDVFAPGGMYDTDLVTFADCARCFFFGHDATYGTLYGWCERCKHTVWTYDRKSVLYHGEYHKFPPKHDHNPTAPRPPERRARGGWADVYEALMGAADDQT